jgi:thiopeptide-type bacteriocin biosynthesis protein
MPDEESCLYTLFHADAPLHDGLLRSVVIPLVRELRDAREMRCIFFARYSEPEWQLRFRVLGERGWIEDAVRPRIDAALPAAREAGLCDGVEYASYQREWERYGGTSGMPLAESLFLHDSLACLDLLDAESKGALARTRREWSLLFTDRFLDLFGLPVEDKITFYRYGHEWALREGEWSEDDVATLPGLSALLASAEPWGGPEPSRIAERALSAMGAPAAAVRAGLRDGSITQEPIYLIWSYAHMHANRLGISSTAEAILRYFLWRHWSRPEALRG